MVELRMVDFQRVFRDAPGLHLLLEAAEPFMIVEASDAYLAATRTTRAGLVGRSIFEAFPGSPHDSHAETMRNLRASLQRVIATKAADRMADQHYDLRRLDGDGFEERHWSCVNAPVGGPDG